MNNKSPIKPSTKPSTKHHQTINNNTPKTPKTSQARKRPLYNPDRPLTTSEVLLSGEEYAAISADNRNATYDHFFEKLLHLKGLMKTAAGRRRAQERHDFMLTFLAQLRGEIQGSA